MTEPVDPRTSEERPRPTPRPRAGAPRPSPRPRVAGTRRDREAPGDAPAAADAPRPTPGPRSRPARPSRPEPGGTTVSVTKPARPPAAKPTVKAKAAGRPAKPARSARRRRVPGLALALAVLCLLSAGAGGFLLWQRLHPPYVTASVFQAARSGVQALYAFDYKDPKGSVARKLAVLTGDLRTQYQKDLSQGGIIDTYEQVSASTKYDVLDVGLQQINDAQDAATLVVFGNYVVTSVNSGQQAAPQGSECQTTPEGAQSCTQTVQLHMIKVDGGWKINDLTLLTTS